MEVTSQNTADRSCAGTDPLLLLYEEDSARRRRWACVRVVYWAMAGAAVLGIGLGLGTLLR